MNQGFALYRMPYAREVMLTRGSVREFRSLTALDCQRGFVVAPFAVTADEPILLIEPEVEGIESFQVDLPVLALEHQANQRDDYHIDFLNFHAQLLRGTFRKLVLARSLSIAKADSAAPVELFHRACNLYPRMFIALVYTLQSGMWLTATPETLLSGVNGNWQTMALAGTMPWQDKVAWSDKNLQEQRFVATYITRLLEQFSNDFTEEGPYTTRAGHLAHLRSDFRFTLYNNVRVGELLDALHPTPAVCGLPKHEAFCFIQQNEHRTRSYYSGFMGPFNAAARTHLFVTLRCMQLFSNGYELYAGGGLLKDSQEESEWLETESKLDTMRKVLITEC